jgi:lipoyl(octanoyl) transferase
MPRNIRLYRLGLTPYNDAWVWQRATADAVREGAGEALALLQHPPVYTFGRRVHPENLIVTPTDAEVIESDRGGDVTYHGPGQLVAYPILDLRRRNLGAADYVRLLEETMIRASAVFGVEAQRVPGRPGVWAGESKLGAIGVRVQGGVTTHGLALNIDPDIARFDAIVPCGLSGITVTSLARELGHTPVLAAVEDALIEAFEAVFDSRCQTHEPTQLTPQAAHSPSLLCGEGRALPGRAQERSVPVGR